MVYLFSRVLCECIFISTTEDTLFIYRITRRCMYKKPLPPVNRVCALIYYAFITTIHKTNYATPHTQCVSPLRDLQNKNVWWANKKKLPLIKIHALIREARTCSTQCVCVCGSPPLPAGYH